MMIAFVIDSDLVTPATIRGQILAKLVGLRGSRMPLAGPACLYGGLCWAWSSDFVAASSG